MATLTGGNKTKAHLVAIAKAVSNAQGVRVGFLEGSTYPNGTPVGMVAAIQNYGAPSRGIPPRPFFSNMIADKSPGWGATAAALMKANDYDAYRVMRLMGEGIRGQLQQSIRDTNAPPLAPATVARKGFDKALIETGHMLNSADYEVI